MFDTLHGMTARPFVELTIPPYEGELDSWGKDSRGQWWGLVTWYEDVVLPRQMGRSSVLPCSGWVVARHLGKRGDADYSAVPRVQLPDDDSFWPPPTDRGPSYFDLKKSARISSTGSAETGSTPSGY